MTLRDQPGRGNPAFHTISATGLPRRLRLLAMTASRRRLHLLARHCVIASTIGAWRSRSFLDCFVGLRPIPHCARDRHCVASCSLRAGAALLLAMTASRRRLHLLAMTLCHRERHRRVAIQKFPGLLCWPAANPSLRSRPPLRGVLLPSGWCRAAPRNDGIEASAAPPRNDTVSSRAPSARGDPEAFRIVSSRCSSQ